MRYHAQVLPCYMVKGFSILLWSKKMNNLFRSAVITIFIISLVILGYSDTGRSEQVMTEIRFHDADLQDVISTLSEQGGFNIVSGPNISGKVTYDLRKVTTIQALDAALKINGYGIETIGDIMFVRPLDQIISQQETNSNSREITSEQSVPGMLNSKSYRVVYSDVSEITSG